MLRKRLPTHRMSIAASVEELLWESFASQEPCERGGKCDRTSKIDFEKDGELTKGNVARLIRTLSSFGKEVPASFQNYIEDNLKKGQKPSQKILSKYKLDSDLCSGGCATDGTKYAQLKLDGRYAWILLYSEKPIAVISFEVADGAIRIVQLQGVKGNGALSNFNWPKALVQYAIRWTKEHHISKIGLQSAKNNPHDEVRKNPRYLKIYDQTALDLLFRKDTSGEYFGDYLKDS